MRTARWSLLAGTLLAAGALLLMHGLDANAGTFGDHSAHHGEHHEASDCPDCGPVHLLATCLAVTGMAGVIVLVRRTRPCAGSVWRPTRQQPVRTFTFAPLRPPGWVELSVMRC
jgi:hypothetical protein